MLCAAADDLLDHSCEPRFWPLLQALSTLPGVPDETLEKLREWHRKFINARAERETAGPSEHPRREVSTPSGVDPQTSGRSRARLWIAIALLATSVLAALVWLAG